MIKYAYWFIRREMTNESIMKKRLHESIQIIDVEKTITAPAG